MPPERSAVLCVGAGGLLGLGVLLVASALPFAVDGSVTSAAMVKAPTSVCSAASKDPEPGEPVTVFSADNAVLGVGYLDRGAPVYGYRCSYHFRIDGVPAGRGPYRVQVGDTGTIVLSQREAEHPLLTALY